MNLKLIELVSNDPDIPKLREIYNEPSVSSYIGISDNFFEYVLSDENTTLYKILVNDNLIGDLDIEINDSVMYLAIAITTEMQHKGYGKKAISELLKIIPDTIKEIQICIDEPNIASIKLFEHFGFVKTGQEDGLIDYKLVL